MEIYTVVTINERSIFNKNYVWKVDKLLPMNLAIKNETEFNANENES